MTSTFAAINQAYDTTFKPNRLSVGLVLPIETYTTTPIPDMKHHLERAQLAEKLGFAALWLRAVALAKDCPIHSSGGSVEVAELMHMSMDGK